MQSVDIGFRAFDPHELLCHFVAQDQGYYASEELTPRLVDLTFVQPAPTGVFHVACGSALLGRFAGEPYRVVLAAAMGPMFKLVGHASASISALPGSVVASFPAGSPPDVFLRIFLGGLGHDPTRPVTSLSVRDDSARLGLLRAGDADFALVSSAIPDSTVRGAGLVEIVNLATELSIPTSGLAVHESLPVEKPALVESMVRVHRRGLGVIGQDVQTVVRCLTEWFRLSTQDAEEMASSVQALFSADGRCSKAEAEQAVALVRAELQSKSSVRWSDLYVTT